MSDWAARERASFRQQDAEAAGAKLASLITRDRNVGDLLRLDYGEALVLVHDFMRSQVGGVPLGCFLIATAIAPQSRPDAAREDTSVILLRVTGAAALPNASETEGFRFMAGQRASHKDETWDDPTKLDQWSLNQLRYSGLRCRVLGTFMMRRERPRRWDLTFGADIANFYSGRGMKVYKPDGAALSAIVNFARPLPPDDPAHVLSNHRIRIGRVRYAASEREGDTTRLVPVTLDPADLLARRVALFGMSRTGKSNTTKVIARSIFRLREINPEKGRVGQLILDPNGEYANDNAQDQGSLRGIWRSTRNSVEADVVTYGLHRHPRDPGRRIIKLNFLGTEPNDWRNREQVVHALEPLLQGKVIIDGALARDSSTSYIRAWRNADLEPPEEYAGGAPTRYRRIIAAYRTILVAAGFKPPVRNAGRPRFDGLFGNGPNDIRTALARDAAYQRTATLMGKPWVTWSEAREAFEGLREAMAERGGAYATFNQNYKNLNDGRDWHDPALENLLAILEYRGGLRRLGELKDQHSAETSGDYADRILEDLRDGRLVIVDQSTGDPDMNEAAAKRLMWRLFDRQRQVFRDAEQDAEGNLIHPPDIMVYVEEAHNLLPANGADLRDIWPRVAKEGSKYRIGLVYATQEPSSILPNILKNTDNWFVAHLNTAEEVRELRDFYDFEDFAQQIRQVPEPGFIRMRTLSNPYIVPVQIDRFVASDRGDGTEAAPPDDEAAGDVGNGDGQAPAA